MSKPIRFTPYAFAKLSFLRDVGNTEIGGFGIAGTDDPLLITDIWLPEQECTLTTVELDGESLLDYRKAMRQQDIDEKHSFRVWIHTHPKMDATPSATDWDTFSELFEHTEWGVMVILSKTEDKFARVCYGGDGPTAETDIGFVVDYSVEFQSSNHADWLQEYASAVTEISYLQPQKTPLALPNQEPITQSEHEGYNYADWFDPNYSDNEGEVCVDVLECISCREEFEYCDAVDADGDYCPKCGCDDFRWLRSYWLDLTTPDTSKPDTP